MAIIKLKKKTKQNTRHKKKVYNVDGIQVLTWNNTICKRGIWWWVDCYILNLYIPAINKISKV